VKKSNPWEGLLFRKVESSVDDEKPLPDAQAFDVMEERETD